ncbi:anti-phage protein KwaA [Paenibacillus sp. FSL K6-3166]|uniref:anti-phage protein KwaA n=1 Tax=unclassified Paenibacillus TaxID=185978 RepID=UPI000BA064AB|nr:anti-phage protein KwaA [Paenibacillus sp. VTT E-133291]MBY3618629.1 hypothetical protein [Acinetobacter sp. CUI P1]OZQ97249.1 hypothetical protein CA598_06750 [Paenibacillus sp. VTT E-133291]
MRSWVRATLFFSSISPLFLVLCTQLINFDYLQKLTWKQIAISIYELDRVFTNNTLFLVFLIICIVPNVILVIVLTRCKRYGSHELTITQVATKNSDVLNYIATYLIPFASFKTDKLNDLISFILLMIILTIVYVNANIFYINPLLNVFGFHIYLLNDNHIVITKASISNGAKINLYSIQDNIYLGVK